MRQQRTIILLSGLFVVLVAVASALAWVAGRREAQCLPVPLLWSELLPNASLAPDPAQPTLAQGWGFHTSSGVALQHPSQKQGFDLDGNDRALQLIGIANYIETPAVTVQPGHSYCFTAQALTDEAQKGATRVQLQFRWFDTAGALVGEAASDWQPVALWQPGATRWSPLQAAFAAPPGAAGLHVRVQPAADNRLYLDAMHARALTTDAPVSLPIQLASVAVKPWPHGAQAAVSFSFDWETTMGGLVHSRSLVADDPNNAEPPRERGLRMRQGITNTLELFRSYNIRATYYATGYNFLRGNTAQRTFMDDPTFPWATQANGWKSDWSQRRWFSTDPHSALPNDPDYYFADLLPALRAAGQDIQTHTFSHLYGGYASQNEWRADFGAWRDVAAAQSIAPARSLAFPWSGSGGMSDASWQVLEQAGITSVTRTNRSQSQYQLVTPADPHCRPVPGHERILVCPDFYLTPQSAAQALTLLDNTRQAGGMIDLWAHTEEVTSPEQIAAWTQVVRRTAALRDAGQLWIAPLAEIADWQQAVAQLRIEPHTPGAQAALDFTITNTSAHPLNGITLELPFAPARIAVNGNTAGDSFAVRGTSLMLTMQAGQAVEVQAWPA